MHSELAKNHNYHLYNFQWSLHDRFLSRIQQCRKVTSARNLPKARVFFESLSPRDKERWLLK